MAKPFIRIGNLTLNTNDILEVDHEYWPDDSLGAYVQVVTRALVIDSDYGGLSLASCSVAHNFAHGTPEAQALLSWLEGQTEVLA